MEREVWVEGWREVGMERVVGVEGGGVETGWLTLLKKQKVDICGGFCYTTSPWNVPKDEVPTLNLGKPRTQLKPHFCLVDVNRVRAKNSVFHLAVQCGSIDALQVCVFVNRSASMLPHWTANSCFVNKPAAGLCFCKQEFGTFCRFVFFNRSSARSAGLCFSTGVRHILQICVFQQEFGTFCRFVFYDLRGRRWSAPLLHSLLHLSAICPAGRQCPPFVLLVRSSL